MLINTDCAHARVLVWSWIRLGHYPLMCFETQVCNNDRGIMSTYKMCLRTCSCARAIAWFVWLLGLLQCPAPHVVMERMDCMCSTWASTHVFFMMAVEGLQLSVQIHLQHCQYCIPQTSATWKVSAGDFCLRKSVLICKTTLPTYLSMLLCNPKQNQFK